jgi:hypothetical protein
MVRHRQRFLDSMGVGRPPRESARVQGRGRKRAEFRTIWRNSWLLRIEVADPLCRSRNPHLRFLAYSCGNCRTAESPDLHGIETISLLPRD